MVGKNDPLFLIHFFRLLFSFFLALIFLIIFQVVLKQLSKQRKSNENLLLLFKATHTCALHHICCWVQGGYVDRRGSRCELPARNSTRLKCITVRSKPLLVLLYIY